MICDSQVVRTSECTVCIGIYILYKVRLWLFQWAGSWINLRKKNSQRFQTLSLWAQCPAILHVWLLVAGLAPVVSARVAATSQHSSAHRWHRWSRCRWRRWGRWRCWPVLWIPPKHGQPPKARRWTRTNAKGAAKNCAWKPENPPSQHSAAPRRTHGFKANRKTSCDGLGLPKDMYWLMLQKFIKCRCVPGICLDAWCLRTAHHKPIVLKPGALNWMSGFQATQLLAANNQKPFMKNANSHS